MWVENFNEIALSHMVKEIEKQICVFAYLAKMRKFKMAVIFKGMKSFGKLQSSLLR